MKVIIPCAGRSSRFPNTRPKFLLTMPDGRMMLQVAADTYLKNGHDVTFVIVREHNEKYDAEYAIRKAYGEKVNVIVLDDFTESPADTIYQVVQHWDDIPFAVNDCDSFFEFESVHNNYVVYADLAEHKNLSDVCSKSYIEIHQGYVKNIAEKKIISQNICIGGYGFESTKKFCDTFINLKTHHVGELYLSHIIKHMIEHNCDFFACHGQKYIDCGTYESYTSHLKNHMVIFCDIDGIIFKNQSRYFKNGHDTSPTINENAINFIKNRMSLGATVIFTTARGIEVKEITEKSIREAGIHNFQVIYGLPHSPRVLINDVHYSNPWPTATAINAPRNDDDFWKMIS